MSTFGLFTTLVVLFCITPYLGKYLARVYQNEPIWMSRVAGPVENLIYKITGTNPSQEMNWKQYALAFTGFNILGMVILFLLQIFQNWLPLNPQNLPSVRWDLAFNTAVSFMTNTNWQSYSGETTLSQLVQMAGLTVQNFLSAASGMAVMVAVIRGFTRRDTSLIGNFWVDMTKSVLYILLPLSLLMGVFLVSQGVLQNIHGPVMVKTLEGSQQSLPMGPVASQIAIKQLGSNGGGYFGVNSAHPFENPNSLTNLMELLAILLLPVSLVFTFGYLCKNPKQGQAFFWVMMILFLLGAGVVYWSETHSAHQLIKSGLSGSGYMEGRETRFGAMASALWGHITTVTSNGSVNAMHDSFQPLTILVYLFNMSIGEVIFGGVGVGLLGLLYYVFLTMFIAGLMIGRTPEFLQKKLGPREMILSLTALLLPPVLALIFSAAAVINPSTQAAIHNPGAHGLSEVLYAFLSAAGNNGSGMAGLGTNTVFYNLSLGFIMLACRFATILPGLAIAGSLAEKKMTPITSAVFPTTGVLFVVMVTGVVIVMGALTCFPVFALSPILEHLQGLLLPPF